MGECSVNPRVNDGVCSCQVGEEEVRVLDSLRKEVRSIITTPMDGAILEELLVLNDRSSEALASWKAAEALPLVTHLPQAAPSVWIASIVIWFSKLNHILLG